MPVLLVDLDEVVFPFAFAYRDWRISQGLPGIPPHVWGSYGLDDTNLPGHEDLMPAFFADPQVLAVPPIPQAYKVLHRASQRMTVVACTGRYEDTEGDATRAWAARHLPWVADVHCVGWHPEAGHASGKPAVAQALNAVALIDDRVEHLQGLPAATAGLHVRRPAGVLSEPGALTWPQVAARLARLN